MIFLSGLASADMNLFIYKVYVRIIIIMSKNSSPNIQKQTRREKYNNPFPEANMKYQNQSRQTKPYIYTQRTHCHKIFNTMYMYKVTPLYSIQESQKDSPKRARCSFIN